MLSALKKPDTNPLIAKKQASVAKKDALRDALPVLTKRISTT